MKLGDKIAHVNKAIGLAFTVLVRMCKTEYAIIILYDITNINCLGLVATLSITWARIHKTS